MYGASRRGHRTRSTVEEVMDAILGILETLGVFVVGTLARVGLVLAVVALLLVPVLAYGSIRRAVGALRRRMHGLQPAGKLVFDPTLRYAPGHTWLREKGRRLEIGIDDLAQRILPWTVGVQLPQPGSRVRAGATAAIISCGDREARIASPVDGKVVAVNSAVARDPSLVKREGYAKGWLFAVEPEGQCWSSLPTGEAARTWLCGEEERLERRLELQLGLAAADGGEWIAPPHTFLTREEWQQLARSFLAPNAAAAPARA
jgi:glycine cleavage system H lipoate-binding protein